MSYFKPTEINDVFGPGRTDHLANLNPQQRRGAEAVTGPVLIRAGAGTGKTTVITRRIAHMITTGAALPSQILAVTFTRKAANEMRERVSELIGEARARTVSIGNFHTTSSAMLRAHHDLVGIRNNFHIADEDKQRRLVAEIIIDLRLSQSKPSKDAINRVHAAIQNWKEDGMTPDDVSRMIARRIARAGGVENDGNALDKKLAEAYSAYQSGLRERGWCDFCDLILYMNQIFREHEDVRRQIAGRWRFIMVDEFQDTSPVQNEWLRHLARDHSNICVVGDTDQSIYEWRNARPEIMLNFPSEWPGAVVAPIEINYRSTREILDVANIIVAPLRAQDGIKKRLISDRTGATPASLASAYQTRPDEIDGVVSKITRKLRAGEKAGEIAILCRTAMDFPRYEMALKRAQIPYTLSGAMGFFDREEIKDALAFLFVLDNPRDTVAFERISNKPRRGVGPKTVSEIIYVCNRETRDVFKAIEVVRDRQKPGSSIAGKLADFAATMNGIRDKAATAANIGRILDAALMDSGYMAWRQEIEADSDMIDIRLKNLGVLTESGEQHNNIAEFLETIMLTARSDGGADDGAITLSTVHAAKGLEWNVVFSPSVEKNVMPHKRAATTSYGENEERRIAHVAWTRARLELHISFAWDSMNGDGPSPYLDEIGVTDALAGSNRGQPHYRRPVAADITPHPASGEDEHKAAKKSHPLFAKSAVRGMRPRSF